MIINVRGTSGTGKSTVFRKIMEHFPERLRVMKEKRRQPFGYILRRPGRDRPVAVVGHYETPCGGCDTIGSYEEIYDAVRASHDAGMDVLYEGLLISGESARPIKLAKDGYPLHVLALNTPVEVCIASINERRWAKNPDKPPVKERNTIAKARAVEIAMEKIGEAGVPAEWHDRDGTVARALELLEIDDA